MILRFRPGIGFSGAEIMSFCDDIKNDEADIPADEITALLDYLDETISEKRAYLKKVHIPIVLYVAQLAKEKDISPEEFGLRWMLSLRIFLMTANIWRPAAPAAQNALMCKRECRS